MQLAGYVADESSGLDDQSALRRCQQGDIQAFGTIVHKYMKRAYFTALGLVGNHEDALDLSQEAFVRAFRAIARFELGQQFFTWYYKILRNLCLNHLRDHAKFRALQPPPDSSRSQEFETAAVDSQADPSVLAERNDLTVQLWKAIACLKAEDREILILREIEDCSYAEIAERLEIPTGTVMSRLFYARKHLKELLDQIA